MSWVFEGDFVQGGIMNKFVVRLGVMVIVGSGALHAAGSSDPVKRLSREDILALGQTVADMFVADAGAGAGAPAGSQAGGAAPERRTSSLQRWYDSACCHRTADVLTNPAVQGSLQVAMIVLGTTLVASYLMLIPAGLLLIGGAAAKIVKRQQQLDAIARGEVAPGRAGYADKATIKAEIDAERIALANALFETAEGRGYVLSFNAAMRRLGNANQIVEGQPAPEVVVKMVSAVVRGVVPVAGGDLTRGAGASAGGEREDFFVEPDYAAVLDAVFARPVVPVV